MESGVGVGKFDLRSSGNDLFGVWCSLLVQKYNGRALVDGFNDVVFVRYPVQLAGKIPERYLGQRKTPANRAVGNLAFPYSLYFVYYEQYAFIQVRMCGGNVKLVS